MDLQTGKLYWPTTYPDAPCYPQLEEDISCDVLIIGGGSSGAQCAYYLAETDLDVVIVDKRRVGHGSTSSNTALIQYLGDKMTFELVNSFGEENAIRHLKACQEAIDEIERSANRLAYDVEFMRRDSLYTAAETEDIEKIEKDYHYLHKHKFHVDLWTRDMVEKHFPFSRERALFIHNDAELNPYKYNHGLINCVAANGTRVYERTEITGKKLEQDRAVFFTKNHHSITARHVIIAGGYESLEFKKDKNATMVSSYTVVTSPVKDFSSWFKRALLWETARPYLYARTTADDRIIIGGLDDNAKYPEDRDSKIVYRKDKLIQDFNKLFPGIYAEPEYYLGAFYGGTHDGLPIVGVYDDWPNCYFLYAYGDNGLVYSMNLAMVIRDLIITGVHPNMDIYLQTRPMLGRTQ